MASRRPSTLAWVAVHLAYPLLPVPIEGFIRFATMDWTLTYDTFSAATLAISAGLLSVFINQSIRVHEDALPASMELDSRHGVCTSFMGLGIISFVLFGLVVLLHALVNDRHLAELAPLLHFFQGTVFVFAVVPVASGVVAQRSFKLRASLT